MDRAKRVFEFEDACGELFYVYERSGEMLLDGCGEFGGDHRNCVVLTRENAAELWPLAKRFAETGQLPESQS